MRIGRVADTLVAVVGRVAGGSRSSMGSAEPIGTGEGVGVARGLTDEVAAAGGAVEHREGVGPPGRGSAQMTPAEAETAGTLVAVPSRRRPFTQHRRGTDGPATIHQLEQELTEAMARAARRVPIRWGVAVRPRGRLGDPHYPESPGVGAPAPTGPSGLADDVLSRCRPRVTVSSRVPIDLWQIPN